MDGCMLGNKLGVMMPRAGPARQLGRAGGREGEGRTRGQRDK